MHVGPHIPAPTRQITHQHGFRGTSTRCAWRALFHCYCRVQTTATRAQTVTERGAVRLQAPVSGDKSVAMCEVRSESVDPSRDLPGRLQDLGESASGQFALLKSTMNCFDVPGNMKDKHAEHRLDVCKKTRAQQSSPVQRFLHGSSHFAAP